MSPRARVLEVSDYDVRTFSRDVFINDVFDYHPGDHVTVLAPTGGGKTQLAYGLLGGTATPECPATVMVMKPRDSTVTKFSKQFGFKTIRDWPPSKLEGITGSKPPGYALWPQESGNPVADDRRHAAIFTRSIRTQYSAGGRGKDSIIFADETYSLEKELGLEDDLRRLWTKGRSVGVGLWAASQRPVWISRWAFQAQHLFLGNDPDVDMQKRYGEIGGGINPDLVRALTAGLERYQFVYISREERAVCVVDR
jgi:hypothetical protein